ncbi:hypothetical protein [Oxynema aestuarii]|uniref:Uncharacterized protein n=1 Tax=Oxynema aestuarii AP17 TaxID=2064643 RepID=A0A6H1U178_9CYAN|nr:hypothetical protein [Oxynema aestuarii]QIZ71920.1 hypothetical protein HCG48_16155 [Oxynema aestuarii AP17]
MFSSLFDLRSSGNQGISVGKVFLLKAQRRSPPPSGSSSVAVKILSYIKNGNRNNISPQAVVATLSLPVEVENLPCHRKLLG